MRYRSVGESAFAVLMSAWSKRIYFHDYIKDRYVWPAGCVTGCSEARSRELGNRHPRRFLRASRSARSPDGTLVPVHVLAMFVRRRCGLGSEAGLAVIDPAQHPSSIDDSETGAAVAEIGKVAIGVGLSLHAANPCATY